MKSYESSPIDWFVSLDRHSREADVEEKAIEPLLECLGYTEKDWRSQVVLLGSKLDYFVHPLSAPSPHPPYLVIEVKAPRKQIRYSIWQICRYMRQSAAMLGLLTNGYRFVLLYQSDGQIYSLLDCSQEEFIENFFVFKAFLSKETCLAFSKLLYQTQQQKRDAFIRRLVEKLENKNILKFLKKSIQISSSKPEARERIEVKEMSSQLQESTGTSQAKKTAVITVFNNKGGVGKTTLTINLAAALSKMRKRVLLVDMDAQANLTMGLGVDPLEDVENEGRKDIGHLLSEPRTKLEETILKKQWSHLELHLIPSHIRLSNMEAEIANIVDSDRALSRKLKNHTYDYILIDPPPAFSKVNAISLMASSFVLVPIQLSAYPIRALEYVLDKVHNVRLSKETSLEVLGIAVSMYDRKSSAHNDRMAEKVNAILKQWEIEEGLKTHLFSRDSWVPRLNVVSSCPDAGYPLYQAEFESGLTTQDKEAAQKAIERYEKLASYIAEAIAQI